MAEEQTTATQGGAQGAETAATTAGTETQATATETTTTEGAAGAEGGTETTQTEGEQTATGEKPLHPKTPKWALDRFGELTRQRQEAERRAAALAEENERLKAGRQADDGQQQTDQGKPLTEAEIDARATQKAAQIANARAFNEACNKADAAGRKDFTDWGDALGNLEMVGLVGASANTAFLEATTALPEGHKILHHLGSNPDEAARVARLSPIAMAAELGRISASLNAPAKPKAISAAPKPVTTVDGGGRAETDPNKMSPEEWRAWRHKEREKVRAGRR